ncbi:outer membrane efflux protein [Rhodopirellula maiorica SM1]|uniref:Outer membrane efflux protein n=1 Tax=Rhodopirellula maiorica SM1 TaxID=1265738 RepID=M5R8Q8_9BACT|nr:TolC family protein [Rhodopirellula maiorica]EMI15868.1 outer membrane efflux protein [Rhodopirellula maiorica SM1]
MLVEDDIEQNTDLHAENDTEARLRNSAEVAPADASLNTADQNTADQNTADQNTAGQDLETTDPALTLADVFASLYRSYPEIQQARQEPNIANGQVLSAYGEYDTKFNAYSISEPTGFYENYRNGLGVARQTWWGGYVSAGYRIGRGFYQPWYKERQTDDAGEFKLKYSQPLLQGRAIDPERVAVFQARLAQQAAGPIIQQTILDISRDAAAVYWDWVAMGSILEAQRELLSLAERRGEQFEIGVQAGKFAEIDLILNQQLIAERKAKVLETEQKFRATSFKLALYLRDAGGQPMVPSDAWLPKRFPIIQPPPASDFQTDLAAALSRRPEPQLLQFEMRSVQLDRRLANNELLPRFDFISEASQDMGEPATKSDDKGEFELVIGFTSEVPIQRRKARGKIQQTNSKIIQINEKLRLTQDKIANELQVAYNALQLSSQIVEQTEVSLQTALETLDRYRFAFEKGKIDLIYLNLLESKANETEIKLVDAQRNWFAALAQMQIALGLDPLDQAMVVSSLPESDMPGPGNLPKPKLPQADAMERDWQLHSQSPDADQADE